MYIEYALCVILKYVLSDQIYHVCLIVLFLDELMKDLNLGIVSGEDDHMIGQLLNRQNIVDKLQSENDHVLISLQKDRIWVAEGLMQPYK